MCLAFLSGSVRSGTLDQKVPQLNRVPGKSERSPAMFEAPHTDIPHPSHLDQFWGEPRRSEVGVRWKKRHLFHLPLITLWIQALVTFSNPRSCSVVSGTGRILHLDDHGGRGLQSQRKPQKKSTACPPPGSCGATRSDSTRGR